MLLLDKSNINKQHFLVFKYMLPNWLNSSNAKLKINKLKIIFLLIIKIFWNNKKCIRISKKNSKSNIKLFVRFFCSIRFYKLLQFVKLRMQHWIQNFVHIYPIHLLYKYKLYTLKKLPVLFFKSKTHDLYKFQFKN